ncbi:hypothetical protein D3C87_2040590 [compost metagenome]
MTVRTLSRRIMAPARYMSWVVSERSSMGPAVGRFITTETMTEPETRAGSSQPMVEISGLSARRTGYLRITFHSGRPLARAVTT